jgi:hypothetical protein
MSYKLEVEIPQEVEIKVILRGTDSSVFDQGRKLEEFLKRIFPDLEIRCANFETRGENTFYDIRLRCPSRDIEKIGSRIDELTSGFQEEKNNG